MKLDPELLWGWQRLLQAAAVRFDALAEKAAPGSLDYLEFLSLAARCKTAGEYVGDAASELAEPRKVA